MELSRAVKRLERPRQGKERAIGRDGPQIARKVRDRGRISYPPPMSAWTHHSRIIALLACLGAPLTAACAHSSASGGDLSGPPSDDLMVSRGNWTPAEAQRIRQAQPHVQRAASRFKVDPALINAFIWVESKFDPHARGPGGSAGLMQLMPATSRELAKQLGERSRPYNPDFNVRAGTLYISRLLKRFGGDLRLTIAAYQAGPGAVSKWKKAGRDLPASSKAYVDKVMAAKRRFDGR